MSGTLSLERKRIISSPDQVQEGRSCSVCGVQEGRRCSVCRVQEGRRCSVWGVRGVQEGRRCSVCGIHCVVLSVVHSPSWLVLSHSNLPAPISSHYFLHLLYVWTMKLLYHLQASCPLSFHLSSLLPPLLSPSSLISSLTYSSNCLLILSLFFSTN